MKVFKVISTVLLLSATILTNFNSAKACEAEQSTETAVTSEQQGEMVSLGSIDNIEFKMDKSSLESLEIGERQRLLSYAVEIMTDEHMNEKANLYDEIISYSTTGTKVIHTNHSCNPTGPYYMDYYYRVVYIYDTDTGEVLGKMDFYICGGEGINCTYLASITTHY